MPEARRPMFCRVLLGLALALFAFVAPAARADDRPGTAIRVATFNLLDVRSEDVRNPDHPRLRALAEIIQRIRPNVILLTEIAYDAPGYPGVPASQTEAGQNARLFAENFLARAQAPDLEPMRFRAFMAPSNTGIPSGFDLDRDGQIVTDYPEPKPTPVRELPGRPSDEAIAFGNDAWGFGAFPGQYAMGLLVDARLTIETDRVRTFQLFPWDYMPGAFLPRNPETDDSWFSEEEIAFVRLSSKSHWDVPVRLPSGAVVHFLCAHPTPPAFDGPEMRNRRRNHDEIRFWADYVSSGSYIVDDKNRPGPLDDNAHFVILGDLNADPNKGSSYRDPIGRVLFTAPRVNPRLTPESDVEIEGLDATDTSDFGLRVDYVIPSRCLVALRAGIWRHPPSGSIWSGPFPSDHFPVWADLRVPHPE